MAQPASMQLKVLLPTRILIDEPASKVIAEADDGAFCLLPRHVDFVAALVPGLLVFVNEHDTERYLAIDEGTLVKCGQEVRVSILNAAEGADLASLRHTVEQQFETLDEHERLARTALARLEAGTIRRFIELEEELHGG